MTDMSQEAQQAFMDLQMNQQQLQNIVMQIDQLKMQTMEIEKALEELGKAKEDDVYKAVGPILIKTNKNDLEKELKEKEETAKVRVKSLENQEAQIKERMQGMQEKLQKMLQPAEKKKAS